jgi:hypothetical protein
MSLFAGNQEFLGKILSLTPTMELTTDQEEMVFKLITQVDRQWHNFSLATLPLIVVSRFPWRTFARAPELFLAAVNGTLPVNPDHPDLSDLSTSDRLIIALIREYTHETGVGPMIQSSWGTLQELFRSKLSPTKFDHLMTDFNHPTRGMNWEWLNDLEMTRRWLEAAGIEDLTHLDTIRYITQMIDAKNTQDVIQFPCHESEFHYGNVVSTIRHVTGFWKDPRMVHEIYELAQSVDTDSLELDRAVDLTLDIIYSLGRETYCRIYRRFQHRFDQLGRLSSTKPQRPSRPSRSQSRSRPHVIHLGAVLGDAVGEMLGEMLGVNMSVRTI